MRALALPEVVQYQKDPPGQTVWRIKETRYIKSAPPALEGRGRFWINYFEPRRAERESF